MVTRPESRSTHFMFKFLDQIKFSTDWLIFAPNFSPNVLLNFLKSERLIKRFDEAVNELSFKVRNTLK